MAKMFVSLKKYSIAQIYRAMVISLAGILAVLLIIQLLLPINTDDCLLNTPGYNMSPDENSAESIFAINNHTPLNSYRSGLFRSSSALKSVSPADKTIERIKSQLKLQCIMTLNGQLVAYIHINGVGLKKCCVGDSVNDMFTVLHIDEKKKCVDVSIIEHTVTLYI